jgi:hypothetical protein
MFMWIYVLLLIVAACLFYSLYEITPKYQGFKDIPLLGKVYILFSLLFVLTVPIKAVVELGQWLGFTNMTNAYLGFGVFVVMVFMISKIPAAPKKNKQNTINTVE